MYNSKSILGANWIRRQLQTHECMSRR